LKDDFVIVILWEVSEITDNWKKEMLTVMVNNFSHVCTLEEKIFFSMAAIVNWT